MFTQRITFFYHNLSLLYIIITLIITKSVYTDLSS